MLRFHQGLITLIIFSSISAFSLTGEYISTSSASGSSTGKQPIEKIEFIGNTAIITEGGLPITGVLSLEDNFAIITIPNKQIGVSDLKLVFKIDSNSIICQSQECLNYEFVKYDLSNTSVPEKIINLPKPLIGKTLDAGSMKIHLGEHLASSKSSNSFLLMAGGISKGIYDIEGKIFNELLLEDTGGFKFYVKDDAFEKRLRIAPSKEARLKIMLPYARLLCNMFEIKKTFLNRDFITQAIIYKIYNDPHWFKIVANLAEMDVIYDKKKFKPAVGEMSATFQQIAGVFGFVVTDKNWTPLFYTDMALDIICEDIMMTIKNKGGAKSMLENLLQNN